ncbi:MAG: hypothetical protein LBM96_09470 [Methanobrevibacter sp.]|jgi:uncharacterized membrane protein YvbJ|nr:hypothetical protein [Candidatus Methanoflexus mossambicus]
MDDDNVKETKYCINCGEIIDKRAEICPKCGVRVAPPPMQYIQPQNNSDNSEYNTMIILGYIFTFIFGIVGLIISIYLLTRDNDRAKKHGLIMIIISVIFTLIWIFFASIMFGAFAIASNPYYYY